MTAEQVARVVLKAATARSRARATVSASSPDSGRSAGRSRPTVGSTRRPGALSRTRAIDPVGAYGLTPFGRASSPASLRVAMKTVLSFFVLSFSRSKRVMANHAPKPVLSLTLGVVGHRATAPARVPERTCCAVRHRQGESGDGGYSRPDPARHERYSQHL